MFMPRPYGCSGGVDGRRLGPQTGSGSGWGAPGTGSVYGEGSCGAGGRSGASGRSGPGSSGIGVSGSSGGGGLGRWGRTASGITTDGATRPDRVNRPDRADRAAGPDRADIDFAVPGGRRGGNIVLASHVGGSSLAAAWSPVTPLDRRRASVRRPVIAAVPSGSRFIGSHLRSYAVKSYAPMSYNVAASAGPRRVCPRGRCQRAPGPSPCVASPTSSDRG